MSNNSNFFEGAPIMMDDFEDKPVWSVLNLNKSMAKVYYSTVEKKKRRTFMSFMFVKIYS
jgi:hypothetical protein